MFLTKIYGNEKEKYDICVTTAKSSSKLPNEEALEAYKLCTDYLYLIDPQSTELAVWGIDVDIIKGKAMILESTNFCCI